MQYITAIAALAAVAAAAPGYHYEAPEVPKNGTQELTTSVVYKTNVHTVTDCPPEVYDCPADKVHYSTEVVVDYTTVCPVTEAKPTPVPTYPAAAPPAPVVTYPAAAPPAVTPPAATNVPPVPGAPAPTYPAGVPAPAPLPTGTAAPSVSQVFPRPSAIATGAASSFGVSGAAGLLAAAALFL